MFLDSGWWLAAVPALSTIDGREESFFSLVEVAANHIGGVEQAVAECISDDALIHLKSYKYSSVDKSPVSKYILGPWVRLTDYSPPYPHDVAVRPLHLHAPPRDRHQPKKN